MRFSPRVRLQKAADMAASVSLRSDELVCVDLIGHDTNIADFQVTPKALVRIFHQLVVPRSALRAKETKDMVMIHYVYHGFRFISALRLPEAASFMAIAGQRRLEGDQKPPLRRLSQPPERKALPQ